MPDTTRYTAANSGFAELVCADPAWLRAEFDAIIAANFPSPPPGPTPPRPGSAGPRRPGRTPTVDAGAHRPTGVVLTVAGRRRQRSPPIAHLRGQRVHG